MVLERGQFEPNSAQLHHARFDCQLTPEGQLSWVVPSTDILQLSVEPKGSVFQLDVG